MWKDHHETKLNDEKQWEKEQWTRHMLYSSLVPRSLALNTFPMGCSLIVFHLDMWCECEVTDSLIYQLFVSHFLM